MKIFSVIYTITRNHGNIDREHELEYYYPMHFKSKSAAKSFGEKLKSGKVKLTPEEFVSKYEIESSDLDVDRLNKFINKFNDIISKSKLRVPKIPLFKFNENNSDWQINTGEWLCNLDTSFGHWIGIVCYGRIIEIRVKNAYGDVSYKSLKTLLENNGIKVEDGDNKTITVMASVSRRFKFKDGSVITAATVEEAKAKHKAFAAGNGSSIENHIINVLKFKKQEIPKGYSGIDYIRELGNIKFDGHAGFNGESVQVFLELYTDEDEEYLNESNAKHFFGLSLNYKKSHLNTQGATLVNKSFYFKAGDYSELDAAVKQCISAANKLISV